MLFIFLEPINS